MKKIFIFLLLIIHTCLALSQDYRDSITAALNLIANQTDIPGFAVSLVSEDRVLYSKGFGYADKETAIAYTDSTIQNIGSITKTVIAFAIMDLVDQGKVQLDDPINQYLPFEVHHPLYPDEPITVRQLATHTSSLTDGPDDKTIERTYLFAEELAFDNDVLPEDYPEYFDIYRKNKPMDMEDFLENCYTTDGTFYSKENFLNTPPGTQYQYSNAAATLLALVIAKTSGKSFADYSRERLLKPLGMNKSYWDLEIIPTNQLASPYLSNGHKIPHYSLITYPEGGLFTSIRDFSIYLMEMIKGINGNSSLLPQEVFSEMMSNQLIKKYFPDSDFDQSKGIMWSVNPEGDNITMNGSDPGISTYTLFTTAGNVGIAIFFNTNFNEIDEMTEDFFQIRNTLFKFTNKLLAAK